MQVQALVEWKRIRCVLSSTASDRAAELAAAGWSTTVMRDQSIDGTQLPGWQVLASMNTPPQPNV